MSVFPLTDTTVRPARHAAPAKLPGPGAALAWLRGRGDAKAERKAGAARHRVANRLARLGADWRVLDVRADTLPAGIDFLLVGPGGVFSVQAKSQGRAKVSLAEDVIQINGKRPPYVASARKEARRAAAALTRATGREIPVIPVIVFVGSGPLTMHMQGPPKGCLVSTVRELDRILLRRGAFLSERTVDRLFDVVTDPGTWAPAEAPALRAA